MRPISLVFGTVLLAASLASAATLQHSGYLLAAGDAPANGSFVLRFELFDAPSGGATTWDSGDCALDVHGGYYDVALGAACGSALDPAALQATRWLQVRVGSVLLSPRVTVSPIAAAALAGDALRLGGVEAGEYVQRDELSAVGTVNLPGNPVDFSQLKNVPSNLGTTYSAGAGIAIDGSHVVSVTGVGSTQLSSDAASLAKVTNGAMTVASGAVGIGTTTPASGAALDVGSTTGGLAIPRLSATQRDTIGTPTKGLLLFDADRNELNAFNGTTWIAFAGTPIVDQSCEVANGGCDAHATCAWTAQKVRTCTCNSGYSGNGFSCALGLTELFTTPPTWSNNWQVKSTAGGNSTTYTNGSFQLWAQQSSSGHAQYRSIQTFTGNVQDYLVELNHAGYGRTWVAVVRSSDDSVVAGMFIDTNDTPMMNFNSNMTTGGPWSTEYTYNSGPYLNTWVRFTFHIDGTAISMTTDNLAGSTITRTNTIVAASPTNYLLFGAGSVPWKSGDNTSTFRKVVVTAN